MESTQDYTRRTLYRIGETNKLIRFHFQSEFNKAGIDLPVDQLFFLEVIQSVEGLSQRELAEMARRDPASVTRTLDLLEKRGFIIREPILNNRRQYCIRTTTKGAEFLSKHLGKILDIGTQCVKGISKKELESLNDMLERIQNNMS